jgi:hypothetical protein
MVSHTVAWVFVVGSALSEQRGCQQYEDTAQNSRAYEAAIRQQRKPAQSGFEFHISSTVIFHDFLFPLLKPPDLTVAANICFLRGSRKQILRTHQRRLPAAPKP